eukprot:scaffold26722_cov200-Skeletonema_menzelii.AAC.3
MSQSQIVLGEVQEAALQYKFLTVARTSYSPPGSKRMENAHEQSESTIMRNLSLSLFTCHSLESMGLESAGVDFHPSKGVYVNDFSQSVSNPDIYFQITIILQLSDPVNSSF